MKTRHLTTRQPRSWEFGWGRSAPTQQHAPLVYRVFRCDLDNVRHMEMAHVSPSLSRAEIAAHVWAARKRLVAKVYAADVAIVA